MFVLSLLVAIQENILFKFQNVCKIFNSPTCNTFINNNNAYVQKTTFILELFLPTFMSIRN